LKLGFGGTKLLMDAMKNSQIDLYPEYTGTALLLMLENEDQKVSDLFKSPGEVYDYVVKESKEQFDFVWSRPLGFNNTFAMLMRKEQANALEVEKISDLAEIVR
jgi:osmoprotectant transport system permease protein